MASGEQRGPFWGATVVSDLEALTSELSLPEYDLLLVGDGSGTTSNEACAWACVAYNKITGEIDIHNGSMSCGTNNFAELIPYAQALWHFDQYFKTVAKPNQQGRVEIVSDSEVTVRCGNGVYTRKGNGFLWNGIEWFEKNGYTIHWTHVKRNTNRFSKRCDWLAGETRIALEKLRRTLIN